jgi:SHS2 domain-containing protein
VPWELLDHQADVGLQATGESLEEALSDGVRGMLSLMVDPRLVEPQTRFVTSAQGRDAGALFVDLLNSVLAVKDIENVFFHDISIESLQKTDDTWHVTCWLSGEPIDLSRHEVESDVKAATYGGLIAEEREGSWILRCVLDL